MTSLTRKLAPIFIASTLCTTALAQSLSEIFAHALTHDPEFTAVTSEHHAAQEALPQARAALRPHAHATLDTPSQSLLLSVEHPLYHRDRRIALKQADRRTISAGALHTAARHDLMVRVAERYLAVLEAEDELELAQATLEAFEHQLAQSRQRFEVGLVAITDVEEAQAGFDLSQAEHLDAANALDIAREALGEITGRPTGRLAPLTDTVPAMPEPADIDRWTEIALTQSPRLRAATYDAQAARLEIKRIEAAHAPTLDAVSALTLDTDARHVETGLRLRLPLYTGGSVVSRTREARHLHQRSLAHLERERRRTQRATRNAYLGISSGLSRLGALEQALRSSTAAAQAVEAGFEVGARTSIDVLNAKRNLFRTRADLAQTRRRIALEILRLKRAAGTLSDHDLDALSG